MPKYTLAELTQGLDVIIEGDPNCFIDGVSTIQQAGLGQITFLTNSLYKKYLVESQASAVILSPDEAEACTTNKIISANPYYVYAKIAQFFDTKKPATAGIHSTAVIGQDCSIDPSATIGAHCVIGDQVIIGPNVVVGPSCIIEDKVSIGANSSIAPRVVIGARVQMGKEVHLASGVVVGSDGFGYAKHKANWQKIPQLGTVIIGDRVEIGANTTVDRGAIDDTVIEAGVKLDNLIQVGHNVRIGENTIIAGCVGIAGSAVIGKNCMIGGGTGIAGHITVADNVIVNGMTALSKSVREPGVYSSGVGGVVTNQEFRKNSARFHRLEQLMERVKVLEAALQEIEEGRTA